MSNTNRDYTIIYDVKNSSLILSRPLVFYITDKNTSNIFVRLVKKVETGDGIDQYTDIENASGYILLMRTIKPNDEVINIKATQHESGSIFEFDLTEGFKDIPGTYICELMISTMVNGRQELLTSDSFTYEVKRSILSKIDEIIEHKETTVEKLLNEVDAAKAELSSQVQASNDKIENTKGELNLQIQASNDKIENIKGELNSQIQDIRNQAPMNILFLGAKNDGSEDIGSIINQYTDRYSLYIPEGIYKVSTPIVLKNSLYGSGYLRDLDPENKNQTVLKSELSTGALITVAENANHLNIKDLALYLNGEENGIDIKLKTRSSRLAFSNIGICNLSGVGINSIPEIGISRLIFINDISIFGKAFANSTGIVINANSFDSRLSNIEIMGTKYGMNIHTMVYGDNIHIWTGCIAGHDENDWWADTRGIQSFYSGHIFFNNLYLDSCFIPFVFFDKGVINVTNFIYWEDESMGGCSRSDGSIMYIPEASDKTRLIINNGIINTAARMLYVSNLGRKIKLTDVVFNIRRELNNSNRTFYPFTPYKISYYRYFLNSTSEDTYVPIACINLFDDINDTTNRCGTYKANVGMGGGQDLTLYVNKPYDGPLDVKLTKNNGRSHEFYYKIDDQLLYIYTFVGKNSEQEFTITTEYSNGLKLLDIDSITNDGGELYYFPNNQKNTQGLTQIVLS